jgi:hypothetical protein
MGCLLWVRVTLDCKSINICINYNAIYYLVLIELNSNNVTSSSKIFIRISDIVQDKQPVVSPLVGNLLPVMIVVFTPLSTIFQLNIVAIILLMEETGVPGVISITYYNIIIDSLYE